MATPEGKIQLEILKYLRSHGVFCFRNQPSTYNHKLGIYQSNPYVMKGTPDIIAIINGKFVGIEVKTKTGKMSADQVLFKKRLEANGGVYVLARSVDNVAHLVG